jgi:hypothetical protein
MPKAAPHGPLLGDELAWAIELLTDKQLHAYRYRREGHALNWIATRLGVTRPRVVHLIAASEKRLGYEPTVTAKKKTPYKSVARRQVAAESAWDACMREQFADLAPDERRRIIRILEEAGSDDELDRRLRKRLGQLERERRQRERALLSPDADHDNDYSSAVGEQEAEFAAEMEADFGTNPQTGEAMRPEDLVADDGKGYDRGL